MSLEDQPMYFKTQEFKQLQQLHNIQLENKLGFYMILQLNSHQYYTDESINGFLLIDVYDQNSQFTIKGNIILQLKGTITLGDFINKAIGASESSKFDQSSNQQINESRKIRFINTEGSDSNKRSLSKNSSFIKGKANQSNVFKVSQQKQSIQFLKTQYKLFKVDNQLGKGQLQIPFIIKLEDRLPPSMKFLEKQSLSIGIQYQMKVLVPVVQKQFFINKQQKCQYLKLEKEIQILKIYEKNIKKKVSNKLNKQNYEEDSKALSSIKQGAVPSLNQDLHVNLNDQSVRLSSASSVQIQ
ncbi:UNKNOWN [Stylonychia lemnae]|uniref:Uncharacterized protein n=1 Tax=Stylonychia lemnae TaxID=5949 RepID=A0A078A616_STYLE|nr:UNKNOWN [Stylonychia lemnae]|eukprot:CDW77639.1 UNKNOWN [Stylonychia lemnae]